MTTAIGSPSLTHRTAFVYGVGTFRAPTCSAIAIPADRAQRRALGNNLRREVCDTFLAPDTENEGVVTHYGVNFTSGSATNKDIAEVLRPLLQEPRIVGSKPGSDTTRVAHILPYAALAATMYPFNAFALVPMARVVAGVLSLGIGLRHVHLASERELAMRTETMPIDMSVFVYLDDRRLVTITRRAGGSVFTNENDGRRTFVFFNSRHERAFGVGSRLGIWTRPLHVFYEPVRPLTPAGLGVAHDFHRA